MENNQKSVVATRLYVVTVRGVVYLVETTHPTRALNHVLRMLKDEISVEVCSTRRALQLGQDGARILVPGSDGESAGDE
jgi:hypothetical protein